MMTITSLPSTQSIDAPYGVIACPLHGAHPKLPDGGVDLTGLPTPVVARDGRPAAVGFSAIGVGGLKTNVCGGCRYGRACDLPSTCRAATYPSATSLRRRVISPRRHAHSHGAKSGFSFLLRQSAPRGSVAARRAQRTTHPEQLRRGHRRDDHLEQRTVGVGRRLRHPKTQEHHRARGGRRDHRRANDVHARLNRRRARSKKHDHDFRIRISSRATR